MLTKYSLKNSQKYTQNINNQMNNLQAFTKYVTFYALIILIIYHFISKNKWLNP